MPSDRPHAVATPLIENDRAIVTEWRFAPGAATGWHRHAYDYVVVPLTTGTLRIRDEKAETDADLVAGRSYYRPLGVEHDVANVNPHEFVFVEVELKR
jgi:quercetin dioxygenase-like cupin family protein